jgi:hypothetical protein
VLIDDGISIVVQERENDLQAVERLTTVFLSLTNGVVGGKSRQIKSNLETALVSVTERIATRENHP